MSIFEFSKEVIDTCALTDFVKDLEILIFDEPVAKLRAHIDKNTFIETFFNSDTGKYSFALIKNNTRIFGIDNTKDWHIHPFESPEAHLPFHSISFKDFVEAIEENKSKWYEL